MSALTSLHVRGLLATCALALLCACPGPGTTRCGEATCQRGYSCDPKHELCVLPTQLVDCVGLPDGTACTVRGAGGYLCDQEVCIPATCGDGYVTGAEQCDGENLGGATCASLGLRGGTLACTGECRFDTTGCLGAGPVITGIEGTGVAAQVAPRPEDQGAYEAVPTADRRPASQRVSGSERELVVNGASLAGATAARGEGQAGQGTITFEIQPGGTDTMVRLRFPATMAVTAGGLFLLTLTTVAGEAEAQVFFLQGEAGQCTNTITGDLTVTGTIMSNAASIGQLTVMQSYTLPPCPEGYEEDTAVFGGAFPDVHVCIHPTTGDEMVKAGDFWIDRYEASLWSDSTCSGTQYGAYGADDYPMGFPDNGHATTRVYSCSIVGVMPSGTMTWFQAEQGCAAMGKRLCSNDEWQIAVAGTYDEGTAEQAASHQCRIDATNTGPRQTGQANNPTPGSLNHCISSCGAEDLIGNLDEWTAEWSVAGVPWQVNDGQAAVAVWGADFGDDTNWNVNGTAYSLGDQLVNGRPVAGVRGGYWAEGPNAGAFHLNLRFAPSYRSYRFGARCCRSR